MVFANLLASMLLMVLAEPIIRLLFEGRKFDETSTAQTTLALVCLAPGLVAFSVVNVLARAFYALGDTKTPMKTGVFCLMLNLALAAVLVWHFKQGGLGIANTITSMLNMGLLAYALRRKLKRLEWQTLRATLWPVLMGGALAGVTAWIGWRWWEQSLGHATPAMRLGAVFAPASVAGLIYWVLALACKVPAARDITRLAFASLRRCR